MKRTFLLHMMLAAVAGVCSAQDTITSREPIANYYNSYMPETDTVFLVYSVAFARNDVSAKYFFTKDSLTVYGIAVAIFDPAYVDAVCSQVYDYKDSSYSGCNESLRLYRADPGMPTQLGEDLPISIMETPVSYYWDINRRYLPSFQEVPPIPVYERYFESSHRVVDSFYVGFTHYSYDELEGLPAVTRYGIGPVGLTRFPSGWPPVWERRLEYYNTRWHYDNETGSYPNTTLIFPILTPNPDTTGVDDPQAVEGSEMLRRMVSVSPNPASGQVKVVSSFGLTRVEAYAADGRKVLDSKAEGLSLTLDIATWPSGTYMLRVHTPMGVVGRKLVVR